MGAKQTNALGTKLPPRPFPRGADSGHPPGRSPGAAAARPGSARAARSAPRTSSLSRSRRSGRSAGGRRLSPWRSGARRPAGFRRSTSGYAPSEGAGTSCQGSALNVQARKGTKTLPQKTVCGAERRSRARVERSLSPQVSRPGGGD